ncbi:hypothetical protein HPT29_026510 (plasmid) [Microvirga terrae]|uniref:Baseplate protein J-like domain-containing protein n=1 Tax=Microvirga terrae TaxID=2740529 RepID=A0ABY5RZ00_9HYPH|nr:hypothetical protein [Microvirga terrae]UVF22238.1 hypothetical protein HPT29_026510 [Microvirga terrae]
MAIADTRLVVLPFPQHWDGGRLFLNVLVGAFGHPLQPLIPGEPAFADAQIKFVAKLIPSLDRLPTPADVTAEPALVVADPADKKELFQTLATRFSISGNAKPYAPVTAKTCIKKLLMPSYMEATGFRRARTEFAVTDDSYVCALVNGAPPKLKPPQPPQPPTWEPILAQAIRQPLLAEKLGFMYRSSLDPAQGFFDQGGWLYISLAHDSDYATALAGTPDLVRSYAARIPPLRDAAARAVFAALLFPVRSAPGGGEYDEMLLESELYDDGFARIVHTYQAPRTDMLNRAGQGDDGIKLDRDSGVRLGWDDEQIVIWLNRQLTDDPRNNPLTARDTPLGIRGFRVDVRDAKGPGPWTSLVRFEGDLKVGDTDIGHFDDEMTVELAPSQLQGQREGEYWLPPYFAQWNGFSLIGRHELAHQLAGLPSSPTMLAPKGLGLTPLKYGGNYDFRVRLADLTGGGPSPDAETPRSPRTVTGLCRFRRYVPPNRVHFAPPAELADNLLEFEIPRPRIGYPSALYTELPNAEALLLQDATAAGQERQATVPDPDVAMLRIDVAVSSLEFDPENEPGGGARWRLYSTMRSFPDDLDESLQLRVRFEDAADISLFPLPEDDGDLLIPTARDVFITTTPLCRRDPAFAAPMLPDPLLAEVQDWALLSRNDAKLEYFGNQAARLGGSVTFHVRRDSADETGLLTESPERLVQALLLRPDPAEGTYLARIQAAAGRQTEAPESLAQRFARQLRLDLRDNRFLGPAGRRLAIGCSAALRHVLSPEHASVAFASLAELTGQWIVAIPLRLDRDWTWDALQDSSFEVRRSLDSGPEEVVGTIDLRRTLSGHAIRPGQMDRASTDLLFLDGIDPKPLPGRPPAEIKASYRIIPRFKAASVSDDDPFEIVLRLPIAAPPTQTPRLVSAGLALSPYLHDESYASTEPRLRRLWLEFAEPVLAPGDALFARVLAYAPDPMLIAAVPAEPPGPLEPPLAIDPELTRVIIPGQPADASGLDAMQLLTATDSAGLKRHYLVPLPDGLNDASPELFGFFVYEIRIGHYDGWSTAQARFGPPLRVTGVQHPAPVLTCSVSRFVTGIRISAPYATPVSDGQIMRADPPNTELWGLLYVQVRQADGKVWRNVLLGRCPMRITDDQRRGRSGSEPHGFGFWDHDDIGTWLEMLALPHDAPLSVIAVELLPEEGSPFGDPLSRDLGQVRILRASPLTPVPTICLD